MPNGNGVSRNGNGFPRIVMGGLGAILTLLLIVFGWVMAIQASQSTAGERIASTETEITNMKEYLKPTLVEMNRRLRSIETAVYKSE